LAHDAVPRQDRGVEESVIKVDRVIAPGSKGGGDPFKIGTIVFYKIYGQRVAFGSQIKEGVRLNLSGS